jgi:hypothetical protein
VQEVLRLPIENKLFTISLAQGSQTFPTNFQLEQGCRVLFQPVGGILISVNLGSGS